MACAEKQRLQRLRRQRIDQLRVPIASFEGADGYLDPKERADAAVMMLFGTRRRCNMIFLALPSF